MKLALWLAILIAAFMFTGCDLGRGKVVIEGEKLLLPAVSGYVLDGRGDPALSPFFRAASNQPSKWPQYAILPPQAYLLKNATLQIDERQAGQYSVKAYGVCPGKTQGVFDAIYMSLQNAGWDMGDKTHKPMSSVDGVSYPAEWSTTASKRAATPQQPPDRMRVRVPDYKHMGGYVYFEMEYTHGVQPR
jgi:hypothetical protein